MQQCDCEMTGELGERYLTKSGRHKGLPGCRLTKNRTAMINYSEGRVDRVQQNNSAGSSSFAGNKYLLRSDRLT